MSEEYVEGVLGCTFWVLIILIGSFWLWNNGSVSDGITKYQAWCSTPLVNNECTGKEEIANPVSFKANEEQQTVIEWYEKSAPTKLHNCAVRDYENWSCETKDADSYFKKSMIDGEYTEESSSSKYYEKSIFYIVPKWKWYLIKWAGK